MSTADPRVICEPSVNLSLSFTGKYQIHMSSYSSSRFSFQNFKQNYVLSEITILKSVIYGWTDRDLPLREIYETLYSGKANKEGTAGKYPRCPLLLWKSAADENDYCAIFSANRIRIVAACALVAFPLGFSQS